MKIVEIKGRSMVPTLNPGELVYTSNKIEVKRNTIVIIKLNEMKIIKRVLGLPGDKLVIKDNKLLVNEKMVMELSNTNDMEYKIDNGYFVLGDNHIMSTDSRKYGLIDITQICGVVKFRLWPIGCIS